MLRSCLDSARWIGLVALLCAGCGGTYDARLQKRVSDLGAGKAAVGVPGQVAPGAVDPRLHPAPFDITDTNRANTGVRIHLPKKFFKADGSADFVLSAVPQEFNGLLAGGGTGTVMAHFYDDAAGKKYGAMIIMVRRQGGVADAAARQQMLTNFVAALPDPKPAFADFPTSAGTWHKVTYNSPGAMRVGDMAGATEQVPLRTDVYMRGTTNEVVLFQIVAPASVTGVFDFFGDMDAAMKILQAGPPTITGA